MYDLVCGPIWGCVIYVVCRLIGVQAYVVKIKACNQQLYRLAITFFADLTCFFRDVYVLQSITG